MSEEYKYSEEMIAKTELLNQRRKCFKDHVTPLLNLMSLPPGTVITKEFDVQQDQEFWEITCGEETTRGVDIVAMLSKFNSQ